MPVKWKTKIWHFLVPFFPACYFKSTVKNDGVIVNNWFWKTCFVEGNTGIKNFIHWSFGGSQPMPRGLSSEVNKNIIIITATIIIFIIQGHTGIFQVLYIKNLPVNIDLIVGKECIWKRFIRETKEGLPLNLKMKSCTLDQVVENCKLITKEMFKLNNLERVY